MGQAGLLVCPPESRRQRAPHGSGLGSSRSQRAHLHEGGPGLCHRGGVGVVVGVASDVSPRYGQTECVAPCTLTAPGDPQPDHVGPPVACNNIKLADVPELEYFSGEARAPSTGVMCAVQ